MKKYFFAFMFLCMSSALYAQNDVTKFLGIPVDGTKSEMIRKLKEKGFTVSPHASDVLEGEFNGGLVNIHIATYRNKVWRIMVSEQNTVDETQIRIRFNNLCDQFKNTNKYIEHSDQKIPEDEDISYEMLVHKKQYQALYFQVSSKTINSAIDKGDELSTYLQNKYSQDELANPSEDIIQEIANKIAEAIAGTTLDEAETLIKRPVWFTISQYNSKYYLSIYYDNEYNRANGEDL